MLQTNIRPGTPGTQVKIRLRQTATVTSSNVAEISSKNGILRGQNTEFLPNSRFLDDSWMTRRSGGEFGISGDFTARACRNQTKQDKLTL
jgi:hypothetical protein